MTLVHHASSADFHTPGRRGPCAQLRKHPENPASPLSETKQEQTAQGRLGGVRHFRRPAGEDRQTRSQEPQRGRHRHRGAGPVWVTHTF